jgi:uncharacterized protein with HEPN domain
VDPAGDAVLYNLAVIGEAIAALSPETKAKAPDYDWRPPVGMRNILMHQYFGVDRNVIAATIEHHIPALRTVVERVLRDVGEA